MIMISGDTQGASALMNEYPPGGVESRLLEKMSKSAAKYRFDSPGELRFELRFRRAVVDSAVWLNRSGLRFAVFNKTKCSEEYWDRMDNGGFRLKKSAEPSAAVRDIYSHGGRYATECATAIVIVFYGAALDVYGAGAFNKLFPEVILMDWYGIDPLLQGIGNPREVGDILCGDRAYFANPDVDPKTPEWRGENVIVLPGGLYYGHGVGIARAGEIIETLNDYRRKDASETAYLRDIASRPDYRRLYRAYERAAAQHASLVWGPFPKPVARGVYF